MRDPLTPQRAAILIWLTWLPPGTYSLRDLLRHYAAFSTRLPWITSPRAMGKHLGAVGLIRERPARWTKSPSWQTDRYAEAEAVVRHWATENLPDWS